MSINVVKTWRLPASRLLISDGGAFSVVNSKNPLFLAKQYSSLPFLRVADIHRIRWDETKSGKHRIKYLDRAGNLINVPSSLWTDIEWIAVPEFCNLLITHGNLNVLGDGILTSVGVDDTVPANQYSVEHNGFIFPFTVSPQYSANTNPLFWGKQRETLASIRQALLHFV